MIMERKVYTPIKCDKRILKEKQKAKEVQENKQDKQTPQPLKRTSLRMLMLSQRTTSAGNEFHRLTEQTKKEF